jgi:aminotransferase
VPPSGIRKFFDIAATMKNVISLGIGEPDFVTPAPIVEAGVESLRSGHTSYTRTQASWSFEKGCLASWISCTTSSTTLKTSYLSRSGSARALLLALMAVLEPGDESYRAGTVLRRLPAYGGLRRRRARCRADIRGPGLPGDGRRTLSA